MSWNRNWCKKKHAQTCLYYDQVTWLPLRWAIKPFRELRSHTIYLTDTNLNYIFLTTVSVDLLILTSIWISWVLLMMKHTHRFDTHIPPHELFILWILWMKHIKIHSPLQHWYPTISLWGVVTLKITYWNFTAVKSNTWIK